MFFAKRTARNVRCTRRHACGGSDVDYRETYKRARARFTYMKIIAKCTRVGLFSSHRPGDAFRFSLNFFFLAFFLYFFLFFVEVGFYVHVLFPCICCSLRSKARRGEARQGEAGRVETRDETEIRRKRKKKERACLVCTECAFKLRRDFVCRVGATTELEEREQGLSIVRPFPVRPT